MKEFDLNSQADQQARFKIWMGEMDVIVHGLTGISAQDMADSDYWTMFSQGVTPDEMAKEVLEENDYPMELLHENWELLHEN